MPVDTLATQAPADAIRRSLRLIGVALSFNTVLFLLFSFATGQWLLDSAGRLADSDFVDVWAAGRLALDGNAPAAWDWAIHRDAEVAALGHDFPGNYGWHYPPTFLFAAVALATLPYLAALLGWLAVTPPLYLAAVRAIIGERLGILVGCAFPAVMWNMLVGQNGFLTAALIGFMLVCLDTRPIVAGVLLGLLTYKPQFGILFPIVLAANGQWLVFAVAGATTALLVAASAAVFGVGAWIAFFTWLPATGEIILGDGRAGPQQAPEPVRPGALARRRHDGRLDRAGAPDRGVRRRTGDAHERPPRPERGQIGQRSRPGRCSRRPISTSTIFPC